MSKRKVKLEEKVEVPEVVIIDEIVKIKKGKKANEAIVRFSNDESMEMETNLILHLPISSDISNNIIISSQVQDNTSLGKLNKIEESNILMFNKPKKDNTPQLKFLYLAPD
jgi:hypothetical protein